MFINEIKKAGSKKTKEYIFKDGIFNPLYTPTENNFTLENNNLVGKTDNRYILIPYKYLDKTIYFKFTQPNNGGLVTFNYRGLSTVNAGTYDNYCQFYQVKTPRKYVIFAMPSENHINIFSSMAGMSISEIWVE